MLDADSKKNDVKATTEPWQKYRDLLKAVQKEDDYATYLMLGIENQDEIHLAMPVKNMIYDSLQYEYQIQEYRKENEKEQTKKSKEFLSGLKEGQKLKPVITIVVHWGKEEWTKPLTLKDMLDLDEVPLELTPYINDYKIPVIDVHHAKNLELFHTSVREVFQFLQHANDKVGLLKLVKENRERFYLDAESVALISYYANIPKSVKMYLEEQKGGETDMCQALIELMEDSKQEGIVLGIEQGIEQGRSEERIKLAKTVIIQLRQMDIEQKNIVSVLTKMDCTDEEIELLLQ